MSAARIEVLRNSHAVLDVLMVTYVAGAHKLKYSRLKGRGLRPEFGYSVALREKRSLPYRGDLGAVLLIDFGYRRVRILGLLEFLLGIDRHIDGAAIFLLFSGFLQELTARLLESWQLPVGYLQYEVAGPLLDRGTHFVFAHCENSRDRIVRVTLVVLIDPAEITPFCLGLGVVACFSRENAKIFCRFPT